MATITGTLLGIVNGEAEGGSVEIALCGYGSSVPRQAGQGLFARPMQSPDVDPATGKFTATVPGNDVIQPAFSTYYTVTVKDSNGDIVQVSAYVFYGEYPYDLDDTEPYDPNQPPPPIPPLITNMLGIQDSADDMVFDGADWLSFKTTLEGDVTQATFINMAAGNLYTFIIVQDDTGDWDFVWASNVKNATPVCRQPDSTFVQTFVADEFGDLLAISAGTWWLG